MGRGCTMGLGRAIEFLNTPLLGAGSSRMSDLIASFGFLCGKASTSSSGSKDNRISKWAFEVAPTVAKGVKLFHSLSKENIQFLKSEIFHSKGVQELVSEDMEELLAIAAADMRKKLDIFFQGVIKFGKLCKDPRWHNLDHYFSNLRLDYSNHEQIRVEAEITVQELNTLVEQTFELYYELLCLNSIERNYLHQRGMSIRTRTIDQLAEKEGLVRSLKKNSLWSKNFEEIMEKLVDVAAYIHLTILEAFESNDKTLINEELTCKIPRRIGKSDLRYAYIVKEIGNILCNYTKIGMENLCVSLPPDVKTSLHSRLQTLNVTEELSVFQIKTEMGKTLQWLVPLAENTNRAHHNLDFCRRDWSSQDPFGLQTLYYADKRKADECIVELMIWLYRFIDTCRK